MGKFKASKVFILYSFIHAIAVSCQEPQPVETWFRNLIRNRPVPKSSVIEVYVQDALGGPAQTVYGIAKASITSTSPTSFGQLLMADALLTQGPDPNSQAVGRVQGLAGFADLNESAVSVAINFVFRGRLYNGSTISVVGRNQITDQARELAIVGGTGVFRMARGVALTTTYMSFNATPYAIFKYTFYVTYF